LNEGVKPDPERVKSSGRKASVPPAPPRPSDLRAAVEAVVSRYAADPVIGVTPEDARRAADAIALAVEAGGEPVVNAADAALQRRLLDSLRGALIDAWQSSPPASRVIVEQLTSLERVANAIERRIPISASAPSGVEFVAGVAHDLRSPLTSILFLAETLLSGQSGDVNDLQRRQLGIVYGAALGLVSVASDIIELVRGGDGLTERRTTLFSVTEVLQSVYDIVRPMAEERGLSVHLFPPAEDLRNGYPLALSRVLLNLTTNGLKFTDSGFVEIAVRSAGGDHVEFSVRDTGKGYSPEAMDSLYEPFRRSRDGKKFGFSGTGLGLAISRKLTAAMGSVLQVETRPGWGTRFYFELDMPAGEATR
jgi:signal transduction histidine kinase